MAYNIKKAAVLGSGTMGGGIAALLASIGVDVILMDMPAKDTQAGDPKRNSIVQKNLKTLGKMRPAQLFSKDDMSRISVGNFEDDLDKLADRDWVIEVIIENLAIKKGLMAKVAEHIGENTIVSTNTSGLPIHDIAEDFDESFTRRFLGTHFFNPPRYLHLLEVIPHSNTDPELVEFMVEFGTMKLGKGVVIAKDTPNFIGNRFMSMTGSQAMNYAIDNDFTVEEVDAITGPLIGRPKTATFNLNDLVGFDIATHVARNLYPAIPDDPQRDILMHPGATELSDYLMENKMLGRKTNGGFYKMKREGGKKELWALNLKTREYEPPSQVRFDSVGEHRKKPLPERLRALIMESDDRAGEFLFHHHAFYLAYASNRVPEITETIVNVDNAQKWGFNHEMGPFEIWDAIGVKESATKFAEAGYDVADWVAEMLDKGNETFYQWENGIATAYYSPVAGDYVKLEKDPRKITIADLNAQDKQVYSNGDGNIYDMGDGVLLWEFTTKANTINGGFMEAGEKALELLERDDYIALVVGNENPTTFSAGANLMALMQSDEDPLTAVEKTIKRLQTLAQNLKYSSKPVVIAPGGQALGGGAEMVMAGNAVVAHAELYIGLVEVGVGVIPAGGGCKELVRRNINPVAEQGSEDLLAPMQKIFENIATAKVAESAKQAKELGFLTRTDRIVMNRSYLLGEAKQHALALAADFIAPEEEKVFAAGRDVYAALNVAIAGFLEAGYARESDAAVARKVAYVITGGGLAEPQFVSQDYLLTLEREAFKSQVADPSKNERLMHFITTGKVMR